MMEIAISLAIIGIALVAIIGVLPGGMDIQRQNREATIINQDATVLLEAVRGGTRGLDDLTNYVYAISNHWTQYNPDGTIKASGTNGYSYTGSSISMLTTPPLFPITNGLRIVGLLSTPLYCDASFAPIPNLIYGGYSNHVVAFVRSMSGPAFEKPPQNNDILISDSFGYRILCVNAPVALDTNIFFQAPQWNNTIPYSPPARVLYNWVYWQATGNTVANEAPGQSLNWERIDLNAYPTGLAGQMRELRLTFLWPQLPNGNVGPGRQTFRTTVAGQLVLTTNGLVTPALVTPDQPLYFYQSQSFAHTP